MLAKVNSSAVVGLDAVPVEVEVDISSRGLPSFTKVGTQSIDLSFNYNFKFSKTTIDFYQKVCFNRDVL